MLTMFNLFWDPTYVLIIIGMLLAMGASQYLNSTYRKYARIASSTELTGEEVAKRILAANGIYDVLVVGVAGQLTDHYDPKNRTVNLSETVFHQRSIAAIAVAAHECGHAIQDNLGYVPLNVRSSLVPVANIGANIAWPMFVIGFFINPMSTFGKIGQLLISLAIIFYLAALLFQFVTLPVELNASSRALQQLKQLQMLSEDEIHGAKSVLFAAALTYVASVAAAALNFLRIILLSQRRRNN